MNEENIFKIDETETSNVTGGGNNGRYVLYLKCRNPKCANSAGYTEQQNTIPSVFMKKCPLCQAESILENIGR